jgi:colicin import membrane protein
LGIKVEDLLALFGIKFKLRNNEANGLKPLDVDQAERHFQDVCDYFDAIAKAEAEAKAKADAEAETKTKAIAKASAEAKAKAKAKARAESKAKEKQQPVAEAPVADAQHQDVPSMADQIDRIRRMENAKAKAEAETKSEADIAEAIARIKKEAEAKSKDETKVEVEVSAKADTKVEAKDEQPAVPYIVCGPKAEEPEAPETPEVKDTAEETPPNDTEPEGTVDFDAEFTQKFLDRAQSVIMRIESLA